MEWGCIRKWQVESWSLIEYYLTLVHLLLSSPQVMVGIVLSHLVSKEAILPKTVCGSFLFFSSFIHAIPPATSFETRRGVCGHSPASVRRRAQGPTWDQGHRLRLPLQARPRSRSHPPPGSAQHRRRLLPAPTAFSPARAHRGNRRKLSAAFPAIQQLSPAGQEPPRTFPSSSQISPDNCRPKQRCCTTFRRPGHTATKRAPIFASSLHPRCSYREHPAGSQGQGKRLDSYGCRR